MHRTVKIISMAVPAVALAGAFAAYQSQPPPLDPVASGLAAYHLRVLPAGSVIAAAAEPDAPARGKASTTAGQRGAGRAGSGRRSGHRQKAASAASPSSSPGQGSQSPAEPAALTCTGTPGTGMRPQNYPAIVTFLVAHGYTAMAAAGIAGNIYQESDGNPESAGSGGGGLIGWTPLPPGFVTGNVAADLQTQLEALLSYNEGWAQYIPALNAATTPADAAYIYMTYFERPGLPATANREGAAIAVAQACGITS